MMQRPSVFIVGFSILLAGCSVSTQVTNTSRSAIEQRLLVGSLERALDARDIEQFKGKTVGVDFYGLTGDKEFAREFFTAWLQEHRARVTPDPQKAELRLKVFASALGVDKGQSFFGLPVLTVPVIGVTVPEIALYKSVRYRGRADVQIYTLDAANGEFVEKSPERAGETKYDDYTILVFINYTRSDLDDQDR
ncbi:MAG TPA: hypothetical protein VGL11_09330 [Candidatus Binatia bacterium]|jgi:hypothetical protein